MVTWNSFTQAPIDPLRSALEHQSFSQPDIFSRTTGNVESSQQIRVSLISCKENARRSLFALILHSYFQYVAKQEGI